MSIHQHYLEKATSLLEDYKAELPFHLYLKQHFSNHRKYGSRDRKTIASLCYNYFRVGHALDFLPIAERILYAAFLAEKVSSKFLMALNPELDGNVGLSLREKLDIIGSDLHISGIFPFKDLLSDGIALDDYCESMLHQPDVFLRARPLGKYSIEEKLRVLQWNYTKTSENCYRIDTGLPVEMHFAINKELVVQDYNSQKIGAIIRDVFSANHFHPRQLWDCCAASGGKSIMLKDIYPNLELTVSDIRQSILKNLDVRFKQGEIRPKHQFVADLTLPSKLPIQPFEFIIADVPCSGSGTWARTPEQLHFFKPVMVEEYALKQKAIVQNALKYLKPGGWFVYVTCSVFKIENEGLIELLNNDGTVKLVHIELLNGTRQNADSMFIAIFQR